MMYLVRTAGSPIFDRFSGSTMAGSRAAMPLILLISLLFPGCASRALPIQPPVELPDRFAAGGAAVVPDAWWQAFGDPHLDRLVQAALGGGFSISMAWDRLDQARATAAKAGAALLPDLEVSAGAARSVQDSTSTRRLYATEYSLDLTAGYEIDLWGRLRSSRQAAQYDLAASREDVMSAAITLSAQVAETYMTLIEQRAIQQLLVKQLETNRKSLELITLKFGLGQVSATDVLQQREVIAASEGELITQEAAILVSRHALAGLLGIPPGELSLVIPESFPSLPERPHLGIPMDLLRRRPDIKAAELAVAAVDRRLAAAMAERFPRLSLGLRAGASAAAVEDVLDNWLASLAANLVAPLIDGGARRAEVERIKAQRSEALHSYGQKLLAAYLEVENALAQEEAQGKYLANLDKQLELSRNATERIREYYINGTMDFTRYLSALLTYQRLQQGAVTAGRRLIRYRIDLYRALAGGWELPRG
ncbi:efflux transporter outer membrane subunit, partial [bacterium]|nr:efflux transporter outer membrane subunit [candidate division CSSED10-310 bacterium]